MSLFSLQYVTFGQSQGGALSVVASAFSGLSKKCYVSEPSYCCLHKRLELGSGVFGAAKDYLRRYPEYTDDALDTRTYFDINNIVSCLKIPTDFCLALADPVCLPERSADQAGILNKVCNALAALFTRCFEQ